MFEIDTTPKIFFWWIQLFYIRIDCGFSGSLSICNMHFHVEFHSPHTDKVQQNWILNMKGVREILSPSLDAIAAAFQTNYSALILQIPVWWPVQCMYTLQGHRYGNHGGYGHNIIFQDQKLIRVYTNFEVFYFYKCLRFLKTW